jgi:hypothetical protein
MIFHRVQVEAKASNKHERQSGKRVDCGQKNLTAADLVQNEEMSKIMWTVHHHQ